VSGVWSRTHLAVVDVPDELDGRREDLEPGPDVYAPTDALASVFASRCIGCGRTLQPLRNFCAALRCDHCEDARKERVA
jgi:hypothetical protein